MTTHADGAAAHPRLEPESLAQLRRDCARMSPHWPPAAHETAPAGRGPVGVRVPARSVRMVEGISEYGGLD